VAVTPPWLPDPKGKGVKEGKGLKKYNREWMGDLNALLSLALEAQEIELPSIQVAQTGRMISGHLLWVEFL
jgi:hypothetical protein